MVPIAIQKEYRDSFDAFLYSLIIHGRSLEDVRTDIIEHGLKLTLRMYAQLNQSDIVTHGRGRSAALAAFEIREEKGIENEEMTDYDTMHAQLSTKDTLGANKSQDVSETTEKLKSNPKAKPKQILKNKTKTKTKTKTTPKVNSTKIFKSKIEKVKNNRIDHLKFGQNVNGKDDITKYNDNNSNNNDINNNRMNKNENKNKNRIRRGRKNIVAANGNDKNRGIGVEKPGIDSISSVGVMSQQVSFTYSTTIPSNFTFNSQNQGDPGNRGPSVITSSVRTMDKVLL